MTEIKNQKPCLVETAQGFSVSYSDKLLYSKYNPSKAICLKLQTMEFLPGSVILGFSPVLGYGVKELLSKLPENCVLLLCEADKNLLQFSKEFAAEKKSEINEIIWENKSVVFVSEKEMYELPVILQKTSYTFECGKAVSFAGNFRRVIRLDFSAGVQFHADFYNTLETACINAVKQFWTNRFTLTKFGRRYSRNMFRNLKNLSGTKPLSDFIGKVAKTIYVFGAGESSEKGVQELKALSGSERKDLFILCADTAFPMLKANGIVPDGICVDEAQSIIAQSFIGALRSVPEGVHVFQSLCSLPHVAGSDFPKSRVSFYGTEYYGCSFFDGLKSIPDFPPVIPAFGSVGITVYILACLFRKESTVPVRVFGLDFAYSKGKTHGKGTTAFRRQLLNSNRLKGIENFSACFGQNVLKLTEGAEYAYTTPVLAGYAQTFRQVQDQESYITDQIKKDYLVKRQVQENEKLQDYLKNERESLENLKDILSGKTELPEEERNEKIRILAENRQYLYLHFPDGYRFSMELNFLKRIRGEIDGFLKVL